MALFALLAAVFALMGPDRGAEGSTTERVVVNRYSGLAIEGFLKRPVGWQAGQRYPMILNIHGGPNGMFGFHWELDEQLYAANGYAVLMTNPRGSSGYGALGWLGCPWLSGWRA